MGAYYHFDQLHFWRARQLRLRRVRKLRWDVRRGFFRCWQFAKKFDAYAGFMFSQVNGGLADGFLHRNAIDPTVALRLGFWEIPSELNGEPFV
jgi:hypothetical protein